MKSQKMQFTRKSIRYHTDVNNYCVNQPHFHLRNLAGLRAIFKFFQVQILKFREKKEKWII